MKTSTNIFQVEMVLQEIKANNILEFIDSANKKPLQINHNNQSIQITGTDIMRILSQINPAQQSKLFALYDKQDLSAFQKTLSRLYQPTTQQSLSNGVKKVSNLFNQESEEIITALNKATTTLNTKANKLRHKKRRTKSSGGLFSKLIDMYTL